jgi:hypothetical protein
MLNSKIQSIKTAAFGGNLIYPSYLVNWMTQGAALSEWAEGSLGSCQFCCQTHTK